MKAGRVPPPPDFTVSFRNVTAEEQASESKRLRRWSHEPDTSATGRGTQSAPGLGLLIFIGTAILVGSIALLIVSARSGKAVTPQSDSGGPASPISDGPPKD